LNMSYTVLFLGLRRLSLDTIATTPFFLTTARDMPMGRLAPPRER
jgi:hypothetical protein